jgi:phosphomannomutase
MSAHTFDPTILRAYDIRGLVDDTLTEADARALGQSFATWLKNENRPQTVAVGYDGRLHSPRLAEALCDGLQRAGAEVTLIGLCPTPQLYYAVKALETAGGIMVTGSHNPPEYNGFKLMLADRPFYGEDILNLGKIAASGALATGAGSRKEQNIDQRYVARLLEGLRFGDRALNVAWDAGNGAAGPAMTALSQQLPGKHTLLFADVDGTFPNHHPDPTVPKNLKDLIATVASGKCDLGIAFDGDGDRLGVIDGEGEILWGDQLLILYADALLKETPGATIIADVKASQVLFDEITRRGGKALMWKTGHSLIKAKMNETGALLAGEMSGHLFFKDRYYGFDDALYAAVRLLEILSQRQQSLADFRKSLPQVLNTPELRIPCSEERKFAVIDELKVIIAAEGADVSLVDGLRVKTPQGWWLLRASNTQDVLVARAEAANDNDLEDPCRRARPPRHRGRHLSGQPGTPGRVCRAAAAVSPRVLQTGAICRPAPFGLLPEPSLPRRPHALLRFSAGRVALQR